MVDRLHRGSLLLRLSLAISFGFWGIPTIAVTQPTGALRLGTNLSEVVDYSPQLPFLDIFLSSRPWITQCEPDQDAGCTDANAFDTDEAHLIDLDANGWVRSLPRRAASEVYTSVATVWDLPASFPSGRYVVLYEGRGVIEYRLGAGKISEESRAGRDIIALDPSKGAAVLRIVSTDPERSGNYIRNIRVVAEGHESLLGDRKFSPHFMEQLRPYQVVRFMDWMRTNDSVVVGWADRARASDSRYSTARGVPLEIMIDLANVTEKAPWFTMPHQATGDYVRSFAELTRRRLDKTLPIFVEYSNEVWNSAFGQGAWVELQGDAAWPESSESGFTKRMNFYGRRSAEVCDVWRSVFFEDPDRVVCVMSSQAANTWTASESLECPLWEQRPCVEHGIQALAIAPYMGDYVGQEANYREVLTWTNRVDDGLEKLFEELNSGSVLSRGPQGGAYGQSLEWVRENKEISVRYNVALVAYEGGQHLVGVGQANSSEKLTRLFTSANRDTRMGALYSRYLSGWESEGGGLFMHFNDIGTYTRFGSWGALEAVGQLSSPKYDALRAHVGLAPEPPQERATPTPDGDRPVSTPSAMLFVRRTGMGTVTNRVVPIKCGSVCTGSAAFGTTIRLRASPARGFRFRGWSGACRHARRVCDVLLDRDRLVRAAFVARRRP
jgi:hypothetical protein